LRLESLLASLRRKDVRLEGDGERLRVSAPVGAVDPAMRVALARYKPELLEFLRSGDGAPGLSFGQERLWFLDQLDPGSPAYNIPLVVRIEGPLVPEALARALTEVVRRHEVLRTVCRSGEGRPSPIVEPAAAVSLPFVDLRATPPPERERRLESLIAEDATTPFDLGRAPLLRARLVRTGAEEHVASIVTHHFVADGWSMRVLVQELGALYTAFARGEESPLPPLPLQYADAARVQRLLLRGKRLEDEIAWWRSRLGDRPSPLELPIARPLTDARSGRGGRVAFSFGAPRSQLLRATARRHGGTLFMTLLAGLQALLSRYTARTDFVLATAVSSRPCVELESLIGCFANNLLLRADLSGDPTFAELLERSRSIATEAYAHQEFPFEKLVEVLRPERDMARTPLFEIMLVLENAPPAALHLTGLTLRVLEADPGTARFDLTLNVVDDVSQIGGFVEYDADRFERSAGHWIRLLEAASENPGLRLSDLPLFTPGEEAALETWNRTRRDRGPFQPLHAAIQEQAAQNPDVVALEWEDGSWTYGELVARAHRLAHDLRRRGVGPEDPVGVFLERGPDLVVALLGVLTAGGAYVPLEPEHPPDRLAFVLEDSGVRHVLTRDDLAWRLPPRPGVDLVRMDSGSGEVDREPVPPPDVPIEPENAAYILYTSGSTGRPKGAVNTHGGIVNRLDWMEETFRLTPGDRVAQKTPFGFDVSIWEFFWPLRQGARLVLARPGGHRDPDYLGRWIGEQEITVIHFVPSMLQAFLDGADLGRCESLRLIVTSGEALTRTLARRCHDALRAKLHNLYGPTEAAVDVTHWAVSQVEEGPPPIGRPISNTLVRILDAQLHLVPAGVPGELCIGGIALARGYHRAPGRTAERFVPDPWSEAPGGRLYRTGDLARWREDGTLEFLGRLDHQVKIRGVRIELQEIEAVLGEHPAVGQAAAALDPSGSEPRLVGYVVPREAGDVPAPSKLRRHLLAKLPEPMVPSRFVFLDALPQGPTGKLDRKALPCTVPGEPAREETYVPPRTPTQERLAALWSGLLEVPRVGATDHFFELGGHSLLAARLVARIREHFGVDLPLRDVFGAPTLQSMARAVESAATDPEPPIPLVSRDAPLPLSFFQERLWFLDRFEPGTPTLHMPVAVRLRGPLDTGTLAEALDALLARHEALRVRFEAVDGRPVQHVLVPATVALPFEDLSTASLEEREKTVEERAAEEAAAPFDLTRGPLLRTRLLRLDATEHVLLLTVHHIGADGWSLAILLEELAAAYDSARRGEPPPLEAAPLQYADFASWQRARLDGDRLERSLVFWRRMLDGAPPHLDLPTDFARPPIQTYRGARVSSTLSPALVRRVRSAGMARGATLFMALLAGLDVLLHRWSGQEDIVVGAPVAGRPRPELEGVVGPFLNTLPFRVGLGGNPTFAEVLERARDAAIDAYAHQGLPFEKLLEAAAPVRDLSRTPVFQVLLNVLNFPTAVVQASDLAMELMAVPAPPSKFDLTLYVEDGRDGLRMDLVYNSDLFAQARMHELLCQYEQVLERMVDRPEERVLSVSLVTAGARTKLPDPAEDLDASFPGPVHERFGSIARSTPDRIALQGPSGSWTYGELDGAANRLARHLGALGVRPGGIVAIHARRTPEVAWAVLATLQAGAAFLLLDPAHPPARLLELVRLAQPDALIRLDGSEPWPALGGGYRAGTPLPCVELPSRPSASDPWSLLSAVPTGISIDPDDPACITFTSGSTGVPKGVVGLHRSLSHFIPWQREAFGLSEKDRFSMLSGLAHDPLQRDLFTPLQLGAMLVIPEAEAMAHPRALVEWASREEVTVMHLTPAMLQLLIEGGSRRNLLPHLRLAMIVGDVLTRRDIAGLRALAPRCVCVSLYGATETQRAVGYQTDFGSTIAGDRPAAPERVPLGRGIPDVQLLVVNGAGSLCGVGELGEVWVRSPHLARGYLDDDELTRSRFVPNPFVSPHPPEPHDRVYRTGDRGRYRPDGVVEGAGRADRQIKIRGYRIEPAEVEAVLGLHPAVLDSTVMARDDAPGGPGLVGYIVPRDGAHPEPSDVRRFLAERLPDPWIPTAFVSLSRLPLTPNGKLDRAALPPPANIAPSVARLPARDPLELELVRIWEDVLEHHPIGVRDDFFALGGHSLLAVRLLARVEAVWGTRIPLAELFQRPTVEDMAALVRGLPRRHTRSPLVPIQPAGTEPPLYCVHPVGGTVLCYRALAQRLGPAQPFFGVEAAGVEGERPPIGTVEEMADLYMDSVRAHRPRGPYRLAGWSFGGLVAFEMARRLREAGEAASLALVDTWPPGSLGMLEEEEDGDAAILRLMARALGDLSGTTFEVEGERLRALGDREAQLAFVVAEAHRAGALPPDVGVPRLRPLFAVVSANVEARRRYSPRPLPGSMLLIRPREHVLPPPEDPTLGWSRLVEEAVDVRNVPGDHYTMMAEPNVREVAEYLPLSFETAQAELKR
jgi:amino acid adenylation domain-containing protein